MRIAIIGGGFCGIACARRLIKLLPHSQITIFTRDSHLEYHGDLYKVLSGASPHLTRIKYQQLINPSDISLVTDSVEQLNPDLKTITTATTTYPYDVACIAIGAKSTFYNIPGIQERAFTCRSTKDAVQLHTKVIQRLQQSSDELNLAIAGAGPAGIEFAGYLAALCLQHKHPYAITIVDAAAQILPMLSDPDHKMVISRLQELNIQVQLDTHIKKYQDDIVETDKGSLYADILLWCAGQQATHLPSANTQLGVNPKGSYLVNEYLQTTDLAIYAGGDCSSVKDAGLAWSAISHGSYIAAHIAAAVHHQSLPPYQPPQYPFVLSIGPHWAFVKHDNRLITGFEGNVAAKQLKAQLWGELLQQV